MLPSYLIDYFLFLRFSFLSDFSLANLVADSEQVPTADARDAQDVSGLPGRLQGRGERTGGRDRRHVAAHGDGPGQTLRGLGNGRQTQEPAGRHGTGAGPGLGHRRNGPRRGHQPRQRSRGHQKPGRVKQGKTNDEIKLLPVRLD